MCQQEESETLRSYLDRFNKVTMQVEHLSDEAMTDALKKGIWMGKLRDMIMTKKTHTFSEVMIITIKLIDLDENRKMRKKDEERVPKGKEKDIKRDRYFSVKFKREA